MYTFRNKTEKIDNDDWYLLSVDPNIILVINSDIEKRCYSTSIEVMCIHLKQVVSYFK